jgi:hypothetical protein
MFCVIGKKRCSRDKPFERNEKRKTMKRNRGDFVNG